MQHFTCDLCGCQIEDERYVVRLEIYPAFEPDQLQDSDLDVDNLQAVSQAIMQGDGLAPPLEDVNGTGLLKFDVCCECQLRLRRDPLGKSSRSPMQFSEN